jgi:hypothetical protein
MTAPDSYGSLFPTDALNRLLAFLEFVENYGDMRPGKPGAGRVYDDGEHNLTIGYGFKLLDKGQPPQDYPPCR